MKSEEKVYYVTLIFILGMVLLGGYLSGCANREAQYWGGVSRIVGETVR